MESLQKYTDHVEPGEKLTVRGYDGTVFLFETPNYSLQDQDKVANLLFDFFSICNNGVFKNLSGQLMQQTKNILRTAYEQASQNEKMKIEYRLSCNNSIRFFEQLMYINEFLPPEGMRKVLKDVLPLALPVQGFVFGTTSDRKCINYFRVCDLEYTSNYTTYSNNDISRKILCSHAQLPCAEKFLDEHNKLKDIVDGLIGIGNYIDVWRKKYINSSHQRKDNGIEIGDPWSGPLESWKFQVTEFMTIYKRYCLSQVTESSARKWEKISEQLEVIQNCILYIFFMEGIYRRLMERKTSDGKEDFALLRKDWLNEFMRYSDTEDFQVASDAMNSIETGYIVTIDEARSLFSDAKNIGCFTRNEEKLLRRHRNHPVAKTIDLLCRGPRNQFVRRALPYYFLEHFSNKGKPFRAFKRTQYHFYPDKLKFDGAISFCEHPTAVRIQKSHHEFYQDLMQWCNLHYRNSYDELLCHCLYIFGRKYQFEKLKLPDDQEYSSGMMFLKRMLEDAFSPDIAMFPQYANYKISTSEFNRFFYDKPSADSRKIQKELDRLLTKEDVKKYKELAFLSNGGIGYSLFDPQFQRKITNWLEGEISRSEWLTSYIEENETEDSPRLALVEVMLQLRCSQIIQKEMTEKCLQLCKRYLGPTS